MHPPSRGVSIATLAKVFGAKRGSGVRKKLTAMLSKKWSSQATAPTADAAADKAERSVRTCESEGRTDRSEGQKERADSQKDKVDMAGGSPRIERPPSNRCSERHPTAWADARVKSHGVGAARVMARDLQREHGHLNARGVAMPPPMPSRDKRSYSMWQLTGNPGEIEALAREAEEEAARDEEAESGMESASKSSKERGALASVPEAVVETSVAHPLAEAEAEVEEAVQAAARAAAAASAASEAVEAALARFANVKNELVAAAAAKAAVRADVLVGPMVQAEGAAVETTATTGKTKTPWFAVRAALTAVRADHHRLSHGTASREDLSTLVSELSAAGLSQEELAALACDPEYGEGAAPSSAAPSSAAPLDRPPPGRSSPRKNSVTI